MGVLTGALDDDDAAAANAAAAAALAVLDRLVALLVLSFGGLSSFDDWWTGS